MYLRTKVGGIVNMANFFDIDLGDNGCGVRIWQSAGNKTIICHCKSAAEAREVIDGIWDALEKGRTEYDPFASES